MKLTSMEVANLIDSAKGERGMAKFLKANPGLLFWTFFSLGGHLLGVFHAGSLHRIE